jgi:YD repeat-containing protein
VLANGSTYTTGANNQLLSDGTYRYQYDAEGNRTHRLIDVNQNGQLDSGDTDITQYTWDHRNRLVKVEHRPG